MLWHLDIYLSYNIAFLYLSENIFLYLHENIVILHLSEIFVNKRILFRVLNLGGKVPSYLYWWYNTWHTTCIFIRWIKSFPTALVERNLHQHSQSLNQSNSTGDTTLFASTFSFAESKLLQPKVPRQCCDQLWRKSHRRGEDIHQRRLFTLKVYSITKQLYFEETKEWFLSFFLSLLITVCDFWWFLLLKKSKNRQSNGANQNAENKKM